MRIDNLCIETYNFIASIKGSEKRNLPPTFHWTIQKLCFANGLFPFVGLESIFLVIRADSSVLIQRISGRNIA